MTRILDGFWLPKKIRQVILTPETSWITQRYKAGRPTDEIGPGTVGVRWPILHTNEWELLLGLLDEDRNHPPPDFLSRLEEAFATLSNRFHNPTDPLTRTALSAIPPYTGYAPEMIQFVLGALDLMPLASLAEIVDLELPNEVQHQYLSFQEFGKLTGRLKFYRSRSGNPFKHLFPRSNRKPFPVLSRHPDRVLGYAAGNVIGTAHLISLLAQISALIGLDGQSVGAKFPTILVKNSRQEPIFAPLLFSALEEIDPQLTSTIVLMIWDYEDTSLQEYLVGQSDLVLAAAADFTINQIEGVIQRVQTPSHPIRFHSHGHKVSFTTIGRGYIGKKVAIPALSNLEIIHLTTMLAAVDSIFWDQYGCLSSRVHFIELGDSGTYTPLEYGHILADKIRMLSTFLPRGAIPLHGLHTRFEKYAAMASTGKVKICSTYDDDFLVIVDTRPWSKSGFQDVVNDCIERTIVIRPVDDILEVPRNYLSLLPAVNLQTICVAIDGPSSPSWSSNFTQFVDAIGFRGITGIRTIGRGAFPQLAYSWDGFLPLDLSIERPPGHFTTVEFENTFQQILDTYQIYAKRSGMGLT